MQTLSWHGQGYLDDPMLGKLEDSTNQCMVQRRGRILFNATLQSHPKQTLSPLFVRGRPVSEVPYDSGLAPKCNRCLSLRLHLRQVLYTERPKKNLFNAALHCCDQATWYIRVH